MKNTRNIAVAKKNKKVVIKKSNLQISAMLIVLVVVFCMLSSIQVYESNIINDLDAQISDLQDQYDQAVRLNEDLEGQLLESNNLSAIEDYATNELGMVQANGNDVSYVSYDSGGSVQEAAEQTVQYISLLSWVSGLFK
jgi:cell division protein FtsB